MSWESELSDEGRSEWEKFVQYQREHTLKGMIDSAFVMSLVPSKEDIDVKFCVELGMAIMLGKPILAIVMPGSEVPPKLRLVAEEIVEVDMDTEEGRNELHEAITRLRSS